MQGHPLSKRSFIHAGIVAGGATMLAAGAISVMAAERFPEPSQLPKVANPDPLVTFSGERITTREAWLTQRKPELKALFEQYMYGRMPTAPERTVGTVERLDTNYLDGKATLKQVRVRFGPSDAPSIDLLLVIPNGRTKPTPAFVGLNFCGNHTVLADSQIPLPKTWMPARCPGCTNNQATESGRGTQTEVWAIDQSIERGYAVATFYNGDVEPDQPNAPQGIMAWFARHGHTESWGAISAWAWGLSRAVDYLVADPDIDAKRIAVVGHSRNGKAALVAAAFDERIALAIPLQAGCGGTAPSRGTVGESVKQINDQFPHWFSANFKAFNGRPEYLPFDQQALVALCAPRPVLFPNATADTWANPAGQFQVLKDAAPVYQLFEVEGVGADKMPETGKLLDSRLGYYIRPGKHSMTRADWKVFLDYTDKYFKSQR